MSIIIYGASDDLLEVEGDVQEEYDIYGVAGVLRLSAPNAQSLLVTGFFGRQGWELSVKNDAANLASGYPSWDIKFTERPDREGDPAIIIEAPQGTTVELLD